MKKENNVFAVFPIIITAVITVLLMVSVINSGIPLDSKAYLIFIMCGISAFIIGSYHIKLLKKERLYYEDTADKKWGATYEALAEKKDAEIAELKKKLEAVPKLSPSIINLDQNTLAKKCAFLEEYRNSFPHQIADNYKIYAILKTTVEVSRYSRWLIVGIIGNELFSVDIIRPDNQKYKEMQQLIFSTKAPQEIQGFSLHEDMWWE